MKEARKGLLGKGKGPTVLELTSKVAYGRGSVKWERALLTVLWSWGLSWK